MSQTQGKGRIAVNNNTLIAFKRQLLNKLKEEKAKRDKEKQNNLEESQDILLEHDKLIPQTKNSANIYEQPEPQKNIYLEEFKEEQEKNNNFALEQAYFASEGNSGYKEQTPAIQETQGEEPELAIIDNEPEKKQRTAIKEDFQKGDIKRIAKENLNIIGNTFTQKVPEIASNVAEGISNIPVGIANEVIKSTGNKYDLDLRQARNPFEIKRGETDHKPSFVERTANNLKEAKTFAVDSINARNRNEQTNLDTGVHITGGAVKGIVDTAADATLSALSTFTPQEQKDFLVSNLQNLLETKGGLYVQKLMNEYERDLNTLKELDPKKYRDYKTTFAFIEGAFDTVGLKQGKDIITKGSKGLIKDNIIDEKLLLNQKGETVLSSFGGKLTDAKNQINSGLENLGNKFSPQTVEGFNNYKGNLENNKELGNMLKNSADDVTGKNIDGNTNNTRGSADWYSKDADGYLPNGATEIDKNEALNAGIKDMMEKGEPLGRGELYFYQSGNKSHFLPGEKIKDVTGPDLQHLENLEKVMNKESTREVVGQIPKDVLPDILGEGVDEIPLVLTKDYFKKFKNQHDKFNNFIPENFITCVCEPEYVIRKFNGNIEDIVFLKPLPHGNYLFTSGRYKGGVFEVTSHYEIFNKNIVDKYLDSGDVIHYASVKKANNEARNIKSGTSKETQKPLTPKYFNTGEKYTPTNGEQEAGEWLVASGVLGSKEEQEEVKKN